MVKDDTISSFAKPRLFGDGNAITEDISKITTIKVNTQKLNNNNMIKDDKNASISKSILFGV